MPYQVSRSFHPRCPFPLCSLPVSPLRRNSEGNGAPKAVLSDKLKQFFPVADASALSAETLSAVYGKGGKDGLLNHALEQAAAATEKKVRWPASDASHRALPGPL